MLLEGRFNLGVGSGEALNEHILGDRWPETDVRLEMLEEAVDVIRTLWQGGQHSHRGRHYTVENARVYDLPDEPPPILVSGFGPKAIELAARIGDGFCTTSPDEDAIELYRSEGGTARSTRARRSASWPTRTRRARPRTGCGPTRRCPGELAQVLPTPAHFEQACELVEPEMLVDARRPRPRAHVESLQQYADAGVDELFVQQIGPEQDAFFDTWAREVLPALRLSARPAMKVVVLGASGNAGTALLRAGRRAGVDAVVAATRRPPGRWARPSESGAR